MFRRSVVVALVVAGSACDSTDVEADSFQHRHQWRGVCVVLQF